MLESGPSAAGVRARDGSRTDLRHAMPGTTTQYSQAARLCAAALTLVAATAMPTHANAPPEAPHAAPSQHAASKVAPKLDRSGRKRVGKASFYSSRFNGRKMADGNRMNPHDDNAASKTLPLGTTAKVTNRENGQSAVVTIQDRGPYVPGRIVDLSPSTAQKIGITPHRGVAEVEVKPLIVPQQDASQ